MKTRTILGLFVIGIFFGAKSYGQEFHILDTTKAYLSGYSAKIENVPGLDGNENAVVIVNPQTSGYQHPVAAWFRQGFWWVSNIDQSPMQTGKYFEIQFFKNPTAFAFAHKATPQNLVNGKSRIDHPALDNRPNAVLAVYQSFSNNNGGLITSYVATQEYNETEKKWYLVNTGGQPISAGNSYSIVIISSGGLGGKETIQKPNKLGSVKQNVANDLASKAGGDLSGNYPNPNVVGLQNRPLSNLQPKVGDTLRWEGTQWIPSNNATNNTTEPLKFNPTLGKKIILYPGQTGDVGLSVQGNLLQIYSDNPNADVAVGYDQAGTFNEKFRVKAGGAIAVSGDAGQPGQVLTSNGGGSAPTWKQPTEGGALGGIQTFMKVAPENIQRSKLEQTNATQDLPELTQTIVLNKKSRLIISAAVNIYTPVCDIEIACGTVTGFFEMKNANTQKSSEIFFRFNTGVATAVLSNYMIDCNPGTHNIEFHVKKNFGSGVFTPCGKYSSIMVIPLE